MPLSEALEAQVTRCGQATGAVSDAPVASPI
jgi:hypothetical protein